MNADRTLTPDRSRTTPPGKLQSATDFTLNVIPSQFAAHLKGETVQ